MKKEKRFFLGTLVEESEATALAIKVKLRFHREYVKYGSSWYSLDITFRHGDISFKEEITLAIKEGFGPDTRLNLFCSLQQNALSDEELESIMIFLSEKYTLNKRVTEQEVINKIEILRELVPSK